MKFEKKSHNNVFIAAELQAPEAGREGDIFGNRHKIHQVDQLLSIPDISSLSLSGGCEGGQEADLCENCVHSVSLARPALLHLGSCAASGPGLVF